MAEFHCDGLDGLLEDMQAIETIPDYVKDAILNAQADALIPEIQERGRAYGVEAEGSGKMLRSIKKGKIRVNKTSRTLTVSPTGSRVRGKKRTKNSEIAFLNNYGTRHQKARPFWTDAEATSAKTVTVAGANVIDEWLKSKNL